MGMGMAEGFSTVLEAGFDKMWSVGRIYPFTSIYSKDI